MPAIPCAGDGRFHLSVRLPDGSGFAVSWSEETDLYQAVQVLADLTREPAGLRVGIEQVVHYFKHKVG